MNKTTQKQITKEIICPDCRGKGKMLWGLCMACEGKGKLTITTTIQQLIDRWKDEDEDE